MKHERYAKLLIFDDDDNVLILRRSSTHPWAAFEDDLPGGRIEEGESFEEGVIRELMEETGLTSYVEKLVLLHTFEDSDRDDTHFSGHLFGARAKGDQPTIQLSWEHDQYKWVQLSDIKDMRFPSIPILEKMISGKVWEKV